MPHLIYKAQQVVVPLKHQENEFGMSVKCMYFFNITLVTVNNLRHIQQLYYKLSSDLFHQNCFKSNLDFTLKLNKTSLQKYKKNNIIIQNML